MTPEQHRAAALRLDEAERTRRQIRMISLQHPDMTMADAYAVQGARREVKLAHGRRVIGHKIGLTSKAMQAAVGIKQPDFGLPARRHAVPRRRRGSHGSLHRPSGSKPSSLSY